MRPAVTCETVSDPRHPYVVVCNHQSMADIPLISNLPWEMKWMAKESLFRVPWVGWMFALAGRPELTQKWVRWVMTTYYSDGPDGLDGNDDGDVYALTCNGGAWQEATASDGAFDLGDVVLTCLSLDDSNLIASDLPAVSKERYHIVFGHRPDYTLGTVEADLMLAGHCHVLKGIPVGFANMRLVFPVARMVDLALMM